MTGAQLPAIAGSTALRVPDAIFAPGATVCLQSGDRSMAPERLVAHPYLRPRVLSAGLLVDLYG